MSAAGTTTAMDIPPACQRLVQRLDQCIAKRGERSEKCCIPKLKLRRCLAFAHCEDEARAFFGNDHHYRHDDDTNDNTATDDISTKSQCAAFQESFCFGNPRVMNVEGGGGGGNNARSEKAVIKERIFAHHEKAKRRIVNNRDKHRACMTVTERLTRCLQKNGVR